MDGINCDTKTTLANNGLETMEIGNYEVRKAPCRQYMEQKREDFRNNAFPNCHKSGLWPWKHEKCSVESHIVTTGRNGNNADDAYSTSSTLEEN